MTYKQTTDHAMQKWVAIGKIVCAKRLHLKIAINGHDIDGVIVHHYKSASQYMLYCHSLLSFTEVSQVAYTELQLSTPINRFLPSRATLPYSHQAYTL